MFINEFKKISKPILLTNKTYDMHDLRDIQVERDKNLDLTLMFNLKDNNEMIKKINNDKTPIVIMAIINNELVKNFSGYKTFKTYVELINSFLNGLIVLDKIQSKKNRNRYYQKWIGTNI